MTTFSLPRTVLILFFLFIVFSGLYFAKPFLVPLAFGIILSMLFFRLANGWSLKALTVV
jgi:predicted PurR-regulated permease PerM